MTDPILTDTWLLGNTREYLLCDNNDCGKQGARLRCSGCHLQYYCDKKCQRGAWRAHKGICQHFQKQKKDTNKKIAALLEEIEMPEIDTVAGDSAGDENTCAVCLHTPVVRIKLPCHHHFCYECLFQQSTCAIQGGTMPEPVNQQLRNLPCPLCRADTVPLDILGLLLDEAGFYTDRANLVLQHRSRFHSHAPELIEKAQGQAAAILDQAIDECKEDPFYVNLAFKRAELAADMGDYTLGADLMAETTVRFQPGGRDDYHMNTPPGRANYYNHFRLHGHCLLGANLAAEAKEVLQAGAQRVESELGRHPKIDRHFYADFTWCLYQLGQYEQAISIGQDAVIEMNRTYAKSHKYVALSQQTLGRFDDAITTMRQAVCYETPWDSANLQENRELLAQLLRASEGEGI
mmetsp:Transcript_46175/g.51476  ORF Transcript_46175/g.51476 Transcript_46175/m.51476 type:complete len:405 (-) Transcript_46175:198-1412(-)